MQLVTPLHPSIICEQDGMKTEIMGSEHLPPSLDIKSTHTQSADWRHFSTVTTAGACCTARYVATAGLSLCSAA